MELFTRIKKKKDIKFFGKYLTQKIMVYLKIEKEFIL